MVCNKSLVYDFKLKSLYIFIFKFFFAQLHLNVYLYLFNEVLKYITNECTRKISTFLVKNNNNVRNN